MHSRTRKKTRLNFDFHGEVLHLAFQQKQTIVGPLWKKKNEQN